jgi:hypothetical protein
VSAAGRKAGQAYGDKLPEFGGPDEGAAALTAEKDGIKVFRDMTFPCSRPGK